MAGPLVSLDRRVAREVHHIDVGVAAGLDGEGDLAAVGGKARGEDHAREMAQRLLPPGVDVEEIDGRPRRPERHVGDLLAVRREPRGEHQRRAVGQVAGVGAVLVHDLQAAHRLGLGSALGDEDHAGVEIALLAGQLLIDRVGDLVRDAAPVGGGGGELRADQRLAGVDVPQAEIGAEAPVRWSRRGRPPAPGRRRPSSRRSSAGPRRSRPCGRVAGSRGRNSPDPRRSAATTFAISDAWAPPSKAGMAIGTGWVAPWSTLMTISARADPQGSRRQRRPRREQVGSSRGPWSSS